MAAQTSWVWGVPVTPLERGVSRHDDLAGKRNFHRGLLKRATDTGMRIESKFHRALRLQLARNFQKEGRKGAFA